VESFRVEELVMSSLVLPASGVSPRPCGLAVGLKDVVVTCLALSAMVAMVVVVRVGIYAATHADQPLMRELIARIVS
jgi:hypothetical protein